MNFARPPLAARFACVMNSARLRLAARFACAMSPALRSRLLACVVCVASVPASAEAPATPERDSGEAIAALEQLARRSPKGWLPRYLLGEATYWTVIGVEGDEHEALLDADGMLEVAKGGFSLEPFLVSGGRVQGWSGAKIAQALDAGYLPIPEVERSHPPLLLRVRAFAAGSPGRALVYASYRVENRGSAPADGELRVALRPLQVLPPWQSLNLRPVVAPVQELRFAEGAVWVDGEPRVFALDAPDAFHAAPQDEAALRDLLGPAPPRSPAETSDPRGLATGVLRYRFSLAPGEMREVHLRIPFPGSPSPRVRTSGEKEVGGALHTTRSAWRASLGRIGIELPKAAQPFEWTLRSAVAHILIHRDGPRIQPGSRNYERSWIRDGALTSSALLEMGFPDEVAAFLRWYAPHQREDGALPCCIDARGPDFTPEHDAPGEFLFLVAEYTRLTGDRRLAREMWPHVVRAVAVLDGLRQQRRGAEWETPEKLPYRGLLPESISHEGYATRPVHSYWDDLFALRGLRDAAFLARALGDAERAGSFAALAEEFHRDLLASYAAAMQLHGLARLPASVELGDFDPTSTAVWFSTGGDLSDLPEAAAQETFSLYAQELDRRRSGKLVREAYAPYELRIADAFVRLGRRDDATHLQGFVLADRRPLAWNQWPEILWHDPRRADFLGDLPHGWIGSTFVHSLRTALVFERAEDRSLVLAAGVPGDWLAAGEPLRVVGLPTYHGPLDYELRRVGPGRLQLRVGGTLRVPPGGIVLAPPLAGPIRRVEVNGRDAVLEGATSFTLREIPAEVTIAD
jgi:hypothetical protein